MGSATSSRAGAADRYWLGRTRPVATGRQVTHHVVVDLEHARDLVERLAVGAEREQVVDAVGLLVDLVGELAPAPGVLAVPRAAALLDEVARALDDLLLPLFGQVGVQHAAEFRSRSRSRSPSVGLPSVLGGPAGRRERERRTRDEAGSGRQSSIGPWAGHWHGSAGALRAGWLWHRLRPQARPPPAADPAAELRVAARAGARGRGRPRRVRRRRGPAGRRGRASPRSIEERRQAIHEKAQQALGEMRGSRARRPDRSG